MSADQHTLRRQRLKTSFRQIDILHGCSPVRFDGVDPVHRYLTREGLAIDIDRLQPGTLYSRPLLRNWAGDGVWPAMVVRGQGPGGDKILHCTFLTEQGTLAPGTHPRLLLGSAMYAAAVFAPAKGSPTAALVTQAPDVALRALAIGFPGHILSALSLFNMAFVTIPPEVTHVHLFFERGANPVLRQAAVDAHLASGRAVEVWTDMRAIGPTLELPEAL